MAVPHKYRSSRRQHTLTDSIIDLFANKSEGPLCLPYIAQYTGGSYWHVRALCHKLADEGKLVRSGQGRFPHFSLRSDRETTQTEAAN
jgi:hypothetical protein